jgi:hypothetical protein
LHGRAKAEFWAGLNNQADGPMVSLTHSSAKPLRKENEGGEKDSKTTMIMMAGSGVFKLEVKRGPNFFEPHCSFSQSLTRMHVPRSQRDMSETPRVSTSINPDKA